MAVFIAVCDDNIAMRKQTERLLEREKDARIKSSDTIMYIESFGSSDALFKTPIKYDMFIIDITTSSPNGMEIAKNLRNIGISATIVLLISDIDYRSFGNAPEDIIYMDKPVTQAQISNLVDVAEANSNSKVPLLEIRTRNETRFLSHKDVLYAIDHDHNRISVYLTDGSVILAEGSMKMLSKELEQFRCFIKCGNKYLNLLNVTSYDMGRFTLVTGETIPLSPFAKKKLVKAYEEVRNAMQ